MNKRGNMGVFFTNIGGKNVPDVTQTEIMLGMYDGLIDDTFWHVYFTFIYIMSLHSHEITVSDVYLLT